MRQITLGNSGLETSQLAIGTGTSGWAGASNQTRLGFNGCVELLRYAYDRGITFWDLADQYGSHPEAAAALREVGRENVVITSKTSSRTGTGVTSDVERFCRELDTDYVDTVLLHCLTQADWTSRFVDSVEALSRCQERGLVRAVGVSCHDLGAFQTAAASPWVEVVLARINYAGIQMDAPPPDVVPVIERMHAAGKGVYGMKVVGQGKLSHDVRGALRYVLELGCVDAIVLGMESLGEIDENVELMEELTVVPA
ncbi:MAG: hypothetical protein CL878_04840 [Dehalococcoidia bacterium]|nr:hypothetical protein [Dehalococcoidia bacterium]